MYQVWHSRVERIPHALILTEGTDSATVRSLEQIPRLYLECLGDGEDAAQRGGVLRILDAVDRFAVKVCAGSKVGLGQAPAAAKRAHTLSEGIVAVSRGLGQIRAFRRGRLCAVSLRGVSHGRTNLCSGGGAVARVQQRGTTNTEILYAPTLRTRWEVMCQSWYIGRGRGQSRHCPRISFADTGNVPNMPHVGKVESWLTSPTFVD
jgi:hypothetical protein